MNNLPPETCGPWAPAGLKVPVADGSLYGVSAELKWKKISEKSLGFRGKATTPWQITTSPCRDSWTNVPDGQ